jgi:hypothetical protein
MRYVNRIVLCVLFCFSPMMALAGTLDDPGPPPSGGAMNTLENIYNILDTGNTTEPRTGNFTEPSAGPTATGHTLTEVYNRAKTSSRPAKTGQTTFYRTHDDGDLGKGVTWPIPRFTDNVDGTVTDNLTGLIWLKNANCAAGAVVWNTAIDYCAALHDGCTDCFGTSGDCDLSDVSSAGDWRLPNIKELLSLVDYSNYNPALPTNPFSSVQSIGFYWSSTTFVKTDTEAFAVYIYSGSSSNYGKSVARYVWPVKGGQ